MKMSRFDAAASDFLWRYVIPILSIFGLILFFFTQLKCIRKKIYVFIHKILNPTLNSAFRDAKQELFKGLSEMKSLDRDLRNQGLLRILEIGAGPGNNFNYYPQNSKVLIVEPNANFNDELMKNGIKHNVQIEKIITGKGENIDIEKNCVDVVVFTLVLCSVTDVDACLREAHRVLSPGGKMYFLEHGFGKRKIWQKRLQNIVNPLWKFTLDGCNLNRDIACNIKKLGIFEDIENSNFIPRKLPGILRVCLGRHVIGTAHKSRN